MDERIIMLIKSQENQGIDLLKQNYSGLIHYIVRNILNNKETIEECINDIYIKVWKSIESYCPEKSKFSTWLTVISRNTALNYLKGKHLDCEELKEHIPDVSFLEDLVLQREEANELKKAISTLSLKEQNIFYRKYYYLQKTAQIGAELGMTERSIEGKLYRLRKKLQKELGGDLL